MWPRLQPICHNTAMNILPTPFEGLLLLESSYFEDRRGAFRKVFNEDFFRENGLVTGFSELYYSVSHRDVIRGMHFQLPPHDHVKMVYVTRGRILDAVVDIRQDSPTYGQHFRVMLSQEDDRYLYIPSGFAHGFCSLEDDTIVNYAQTSCHAPEADCGIRFDSCGIEWPTESPVVSGRDLTFATMADFISPFRFS